MLEIEIENDLIFLCVLRCPPPIDTTMARRRKDTTMARRNMTKEQTMFNKTLHRKLCNDPFLFLELWCLMPLSTIVHFIMAVYFIGGGHRNQHRNVHVHQFPYQGIHPKTRKQTNKQN
jgi:hypothetical protein